MLKNEEKLPDFVRNSYCFKKKKESYTLEYVDQLFEQSSSQEIASAYSQLPDFVKNDPYIDKKLSHRKNKQLSSWRAMKNMNKALKELQNVNTKEAYDQRVMLLASVICPIYGVPEVEETQNVIEAAKQLNREFFTRVKETLTVDKDKKKEVYPKEVEELATDCWISKATIPEPSKHQRPNTAPVDDGGDTIPDRLQVTTNDEAYELFEEHYKDRVKTVMKAKYDKIRAKHTRETKSNEIIKN